MRGLLLFSAVFLSLGCVSPGPLRHYQSRKLIDLSRGLNPHYTGPLMAIGGGLAEYGSVAIVNHPFKTGYVTRNSILIFDEPYNKLYRFGNVRTYRVVRDTCSFNVYCMSGRGDSKDITLLIELETSSLWDRTLYIWKDDTLTTVVYWVENLRIKLEAPEVVLQAGLPSFLSARDERGF